LKTKLDLHKKVWIVEGKKYPYTEDYESFAKEIKEPEG